MVILIVGAGVAVAAVSMKEYETFVCRVLAPARVSKIRFEIYQVGSKSEISKKSAGIYRRGPDGSASSPSIDADRLS
jgi:hypothetical protein